MCFVAALEHALEECGVGTRHRVFKKRSARSATRLPQRLLEWCEDGPFRSGLCFGRHRVIWSEGNCVTMGWDRGGSPPSPSLACS